MSLGIYPVFNPDVTEAKCQQLGQSLAEEFETLDELADSHGLTRFTAFADMREVPEDFDGPPEDLEQMMGPWADWFPCDKGMAAFEALVILIKNDPTAAKSLNVPEQVVSDLQDIVRSLEIAAKEGARFRLEMS